MSHQTNNDSSTDYSAILTHLLHYLKGIDTWWEYWVFLTFITAVLLGYDLSTTNGEVIKFLYSPFIKSYNTLHREEDQIVIDYVNLFYPGSQLGVIPCNSLVPDSHRVLYGMHRDDDQCRLVVINQKAHPDAIDYASNYFIHSTRDNKHNSTTYHHIP